MKRATRAEETAYYYDGHVELLECHRERVSAAVRGSGHEPYSVYLDWSRAAEREVEASCTCPRYQDGFLCKHIWATMLAVDSQGLTSSLRGTTRLYVAHEFDLVDDELTGRRGRGTDPQHPGQVPRTRLPQPGGCASRSAPRGKAPTGGGN